MIKQVFLSSLYKITFDFSEIYIVDEKRYNFSKKELINTSTRVLEGVQYDSLYIIEPRTAYLIPLPENLCFTEGVLQNLIGETGILLQLLPKCVLLYSTNENIIYLNKDILICNIKEVK